MNARQTKKKVNEIVNEVFDEDLENNFDTTQINTCPEGYENFNSTIPEEQCRCGVENSSRFSLRVMEAMRSMQRDIDQPSTSTAEEIIDYIRSHYRHNGDLYAQVQTALRQICSQGFVMELLNNEYHLVGTVVSPAKRNGDCSLDCKYRMINNARENIDDWRSLQDSKSLYVDYRGEFNANQSKIRDNRRRRDTIQMKQYIDYEETKPGPSKRLLEISSPIRNAKKTRVKEVQHMDEKNDKTVTEEDIDCTCDIRSECTRIQSPSRVPIINQQNKCRRNNTKKDEENKKDRIEEEDEREKVKEEEDEDSNEDNDYEEIRVPARGPRKTAKRERELKRWIRRCRQECERWRK